MIIYRLLFVCIPFIIADHFVFQLFLLLFLQDIYIAIFLTIKPFDISKKQFNVLIDIEFMVLALFMLSVCYTDLNSDPLGLYKAGEIGISLFALIFIYHLGFIFYDTSKRLYKLKKSKPYLLYKKISEKVKPKL